MDLVGTIVSPISSVGIRDSNIIYLIMVYEDMKPIKHVLLYPICVLSHLMCTCKHCNKVILILLDILELLMNLSLQKKQI